MHPCHAAGPQYAQRRASSLARWRASPRYGGRNAYVLDVGMCSHQRRASLALKSTTNPKNRPGYGPAAEHEILGKFEPKDADAVRARWLRPPRSVAEQIALVEEIAARCESDLFQVQFGPASVERCSDKLLEGIARASELSGRKVHMHLLESRYVRQWADRAYPGGVINHLKSIGLLTSRLTVAHGTWLRPDECGVLAQHGVVVSVNTSSNLRLRSGIAPVSELRDAGVSFGIGLDALALDDDDDIFREMRLTRLLHQGVGFDRKLRRAEMLAAATRNGVRAVSTEPMLGEIAVGAPPDLLALRLGRITRDLVANLYDLLSAVHARTSACDVWTMVVAGREVIRDGRVAGIDLESVERALHRELEGKAKELIALRPFVLRYQQGIEAYYKEGGHLRQNS